MIIKQIFIYVECLCEHFLAVDFVAAFVVIVEFVVDYLIHGCDGYCMVNNDQMMIIASLMVVNFEFDQLGFQ